MSDQSVMVSVERARHIASDPPLGRATAYRLARTEWKTVSIGRRILVLRSSVEEWALRVANGGGP